MTVTSAPGAAVEKRDDLVSADHRRLRDPGAQGHPGHPGRRADRHPGAAVLRPPAARPGGRLPPVPGRGRGPAQAARVLHHHRHRRHGRQDPAHLAGRRQGAARRDGAAAHQPPARLPGLRQGRRVPAAEPGDEQRPRRDPVRRTSSAPSPSRSTSPPRCCSTASAACCAPAAPASPQQVAGDPFIEMLERGALQQVGIYEAEPFQSYFSGNTVQICPVGALTGAAYRFRSRPFDLVSSPGVCEHCASGCAIRTDHRRGKVLRRLAGDDPEVNEEWNCDKGRWAFQYATAQDRLTTPLVRDDDGELVPTSWAEALDIAAARPGRGPGRHRRPGRRPRDRRGRLRLRQARPDGAGHQRHRLPGPAALGRGGRPSSPRTSPARGLRRDLRRPGAGLVGPAASGSSPRTSRRSCSCGCARRPARASPCTPSPRSPAAAWRSSPGPAAPGGAGHRGRGARRAASRDDRVADAAALVHGRARSSWSASGWPRCPARCPPPSRLVEATGARLAWVPRRAGERGALEAGALPTLLPGGRPVADAAARVDVATAWGVDHLPDSRRAATPPASWPPCTPARPARCSSAASTPTTCPTRSPRWRRWTPRRSSSASSCAPRRSPSGPTSCSRSPRPWRRPAPSSTGRAATGPFDRGAPRHQRDARRAGAARAGRGDGRRPRRCPTSPPPRAEIAELGLWDGDRAAFEPVRPPAPVRPGCRRGGPGHLAHAARRRPAAGRRAVPRRHRPHRRRPGVRGDRRRARRHRRRLP